MKTIEIKIAKNGTQMYYVDGKRVSRENALEAAAINREGKSFTVEYNDYNYATVDKLKVKVQQAAHRYDVMFNVMVGKNRVALPCGYKLDKTAIKNARTAAGKIVDAIAAAYINGASVVKIVGNTVEVEAEPANVEKANVEDADIEDADIDAADIDAAAEAEIELANAAAVAANDDEPEPAVEIVETITHDDIEHADQFFAQFTPEPPANESAAEIAALKKALYAAQSNLNNKTEQRRAAEAEVERWRDAEAKAAAAVEQAAAALYAATVNAVAPDGWKVSFDCESRTYPVTFQEVVVTKLDSLALAKALPPEKFFGQFIPLIKPNFNPNEQYRHELSRELNNLQSLRDQAGDDITLLKKIDEMIDNVQRELFALEFNDAQPPEPPPIEFDENGEIIPCF